MTAISPALVNFAIMKKISAAILLFREISTETEYLLVHFGGPFWKNKQVGAWSIPKGEQETGEALLGTALREFKEETGFTPVGEPIPLSPIKQKNGKTVHAWALDMDVDPEKLTSNLVSVT